MKAIGRSTFKVLARVGSVAALSFLSISTGYGQVALMLGVVGGTQLSELAIDNPVRVEVSRTTVPIRRIIRDHVFIASGTALTTCGDNVVVLTAAHVLTDGFKSFDSKSYAEIVNTGFSRTALTEDEMSSRINGISPIKIVISDSYSKFATGHVAASVSDFESLGKDQKTQILPTEMALVVVPKRNIAGVYKFLKIPSRETFIKIRQSDTTSMRVQGYGKSVADNEFSDGALGYAIMQFWKRSDDPESPGVLDLERIGQGASCGGDSGGGIHAVTPTATYLVGIVASGDCGRWTSGPDLTSIAGRNNLMQMLKIVGTDCVSPFEDEKP